MAYCVAMNTKQRYQVAIVWGNDTEILQKFPNLTVQPPLRWDHGYAKQPGAGSDPSRPFDLMIRAVQGHTNPGSLMLEAVATRITEDNAPTHAVHGTTYHA